jgi:23S rRNA (cytidine1920-2'-O)/16S rRNA (cytidine1409-2'-O)-methyltransferase
MEKTRLDVRMVELKLAESRSSAQRIIMAGDVRINGQLVLKSSTDVKTTDAVSVAQSPAFVSRGGEKLEAALIAFQLTKKLEGKTCVDVGSSTGGFTDCLLQNGARKVFAVDVGYGLLHWKLRNDPRIVIMERTNARYVEGFPEPIGLVTIDASFISLRTLLPVVKNWFSKQSGEIVALIKPQFEAGRVDAAKGDGVIRDSAIHQRVLDEVLKFTNEEGFQICGLIKSPLTGPKGNTEFLVHLTYPKQGPVEEKDWISPLFGEVLP